MSQNNQISRTDQIENRIDRTRTDSIPVTAGTGMAIQNVGQLMEVAKLMAVSGSAVPSHLRNNPGACLAIAIQGYEWGVNPFAIANKSYVVNDRLSYESAVFASILARRAPIAGRIKHDFSGEGPQRKCKISAKTTDGDTVEYESPETGRIKPKNSPLWVNDPDQQLYYFSIRSFARRHFSDVMLGIYAGDELQDAQAMAAMGTERPEIQAAPEVVDLIDGTEVATPAEPAPVAPTLIDDVPSAPAVEPEVDYAGQYEPEQQAAVTTVMDEPSPAEIAAIHDRELAESMTGDWSKIQVPMRRAFVERGDGRTPMEFGKLMTKYLGLVPIKSSVEDRVKFHKFINSGGRA